MTMLTPEEAKQCECPLIRYCENQEQVYQDGRSAIHSHVQCRGPDCKIGWRWVSATPPDDDTPIRELLSLNEAVRDRLENACGDKARTVATIREALRYNLEGIFGPADIDAIAAVVEPPPTHGFCGFAGRPE